MEYFAGSLVCVSALFAPVEGELAKKTSKEALQAFNDLIGSWRCTGTPEGKRKEFWTESMAWEWQFKGDEAWMKIAFEKGKYFRAGELHYLPEKDQFQLSIQTNDNAKVTFVGGPIKDKTLTLEREDEKTKEAQRLVFVLLHLNRILYRHEVKPAEQKTFARIYQVGATKDGVPFAEGESGPECIVSGGLGTIKFAYKGQTYYFCCTGCRDAFKDDPEKYLKEAETKKAKGK